MVEHMQRLLLLVADLVLIALATVAALALRDNLEVSLESMRRLAPHLGFSLTAATGIILITGQQRSIWRLSSNSDYVRVAAVAAMIVLAATTTGFVVNRLEGVARSLPILQAIIMACALVGARVVARQYHDWRRRDRTSR